MLLPTRTRTSAGKRETAPATSTEERSEGGDRVSSTLGQVNVACAVRKNRDSSVEYTLPTEDSMLHDCSSVLYYFRFSKLVRGRGRTL